ncbi:MAG: hypothetical protein U0941_00180 [Planctomycetaceae bacterium]
MKSFLQQMSSKIKGALSGLDRVRFRGTIRWLSSLRGMGSYMGTMKILLKDVKKWVKARTAEIEAATTVLGKEAKRPVIYLPGSNVRKETLAMEIACADNIKQGLIAVVKCVEPCWQTLVTARLGQTLQYNARETPQFNGMRSGAGMQFHNFGPDSILQ